MTSARPSSPDPDDDLGPEDTAIIHVRESPRRRPNGAIVSTQQSAGGGEPSFCGSASSSSDYAHLYAQGEELIKADTTDWDPAATLAALSGGSSDRNAAGLLAELGCIPGVAQPSMSAALTTDCYSDLRIKFVDQARRASRVGAG